MPENTKQDASIIQKKAYYLMLEKQADTDLEEALQPDWGEGELVYTKECYFQDIAKKYEEARLCALELNDKEDALRLYEKQAEVFCNDILWKWPYIPMYLLIDAYKLSLEIEDAKKTKELREKLHFLVEKRIEKDILNKQLPSYAESTWFCNYQIAIALFMKATIYEITDPLLSDNLFDEVQCFCAENNVVYDDVKYSINSGLKSSKVEESNDEEDFDYWNRWIELIDLAAQLEENKLIENARELYEEAANICMGYYEKGIAAGRMHPALVAGFCLEKTGNTDKANAAYRKVIDDKVYDKSAVILAEEFDGEDKAFYLFYKNIYSSRMYLEASLASLRLNSQDAYVEIISSQIDSLLEMYEDRKFYFDEEIGGIDEEFIYFCYLTEALINVSETLLGKDNPKISMIIEKRKLLPKEIVEDRKYKADILLLHKMERDLLSIYAAPKDISVMKMVRLIKNANIPGP